MNQSIPFKFIGLPSATVAYILISDTVVLETGLNVNKDLRGSKLNGYDLVRLSVGIQGRSQKKIRIEAISMVEFPA